MDEGDDLGVKGAGLWQGRQKAFEAMGQPCAPFCHPQLHEPLFLCEPQFRHLHSGPDLPDPPGSAGD